MMDETTIGPQAANTGRLTAKDFIFCAVFGVLIFFITMAFAMICSFDYRLCWGGARTIVTHLRHGMDVCRAACA